MQLLVAAVAALHLAAPALGTPLTVSSKIGRSVDGPSAQSYIVKLKDGVSKDAHLTWLTSFGDPACNITHGEWEPAVLNGFGGIFGHDTLNALRTSSDVEYVVEDGIVQTADAVSQLNATWGLQRITQTAPLVNQNSSALTFNYTYDASAGTGVDIYIIDTGIFTNHSEFEGRAVWGATFGGYPEVDGNGHGTHVAGTAGGVTYGVAKQAHLIAVKVLSDGGGGSTTDLISGLNWVAQQANITGRPSIASMSLSGPGSPPIDDAVTALTNLGIHCTVAAGNNNGDASLNSPARVPSAVTVGASTIQDQLAPFTNYGAVIDLFAPGQDVISAWIGGVNNTNSISGTSMATPHVAGLIATLISKDGNLSPADMSTKVQGLASVNVIHGLPNSTINELAHNEV